MAMVGGLSEKKPADEEVNGICADVKEAAKEKAGEDFELFEAIAYKTQVVNGTNYFIKVKVSDADDGYVELRVYKPTGKGAKPELIKLLKNQTKESDIVYIE